jgi:hypothetical protein
MWMRYEEKFTTEADTQHSQGGEEWKTPKRFWFEALSPYLITQQHHLLVISEDNSLWRERWRGKTSWWSVDEKLWILNNSVKGRLVEEGKVDKENRISFVGLLEMICDKNGGKTFARWKRSFALRVSFRVFGKSACLIEALEDWLNPENYLSTLCQFFGTRKMFNRSIYFKSFFIVFHWKFCNIQQLLRNSFAMFSSQVYAWRRSWNSVQIFSSGNSKFWLNYSIFWVYSKKVFARYYVWTIEDFYVQQFNQPLNSIEF